MRGILGNLRFQYRLSHLERASAKSKDLHAAEYLLQVNFINCSFDSLKRASPR